MEVEISDSPSYKSSRVYSPPFRSGADPLLSPNNFSGAEDHENGIAMSHDRFEDKPQVLVFFMAVSSHQTSYSFLLRESILN